MRKYILCLLLLVYTNMFADLHDVAITRDLDSHTVYDTYEDWIAKNPPQTSHITEVERMFPNPKGDNVLIIIEEDLFEDIKFSIQTYQVDLGRDGFNPIVLLCQDICPEDLKQEMVEYYQTYNYVCAVFIGDLPVEWYRCEDLKCDIGKDYKGWVTFPCDHYFTDLDGTWLDTDSDGIYDDHQGDVQPEIGLGRIKTSGMTILSLSEANLINKYFEHNHLFRLGIESVSDTALLYIDDEWFQHGNAIKEAMEYAYPYVELIDDPEMTNSVDYRENRLTANYEFIHILAHASIDHHHFIDGGSVSAYNIAEIKPRTHFYIICGCYASCFTGNNNLGGIYIFSNDHGLATIGSTKKTTGISFKTFYQSFSQQFTFGESFRKWWINCVEAGNPFHYGLVIQGDPLLRKEYEPDDDVFAYFFADSTVGYCTQTVHFADFSVSSASIESWQWDFQNDGIVDSYEQNPFHTYTEIGQYSVSLTVTDANGSVDSVVRENYISIHVYPVLNITQNTAFLSIQNGIDNSIEGDTIIVEENLHKGAIDFNGKNITVASRYLITQDTSYISRTFLDGCNGNTVVKFQNGEDSTAVLMGFTIQNGNCCIGGGICCENSSPSLSHLRISGNKASAGAGIYCFNSSINIDHVTITDNDAEYYGGGIYCKSHSSVIIHNSILWDNSPEEIYLKDSEGGNEVTVLYSDVQGGEEAIVTTDGTINWLEGNIDEDPKFVNQTNNNYHLSWTHFSKPDSTKSPCIDAGDPTSPYDPDDTVADMGAYYFNQNCVADPADLTMYHLKSYPNPQRSDDCLNVSFTLYESCSVDLELFNIKGQKVATLLDQFQLKGNHKIAGLIVDLPSGIYLTKLSIYGVVKEVSKVVVLR